MIANEELKDIHFPKAGWDTSMGFGKQPNRPMRHVADYGVSVSGASVTKPADYARSSAYVVNVRAFEPETLRLRGGSRPGLSRWINAVTVDGWIVQELGVLVATGITPPGGGAVQQSNSGRVVTLVAVNQGNIYVANPGDSAWTTPTNNTGNTPPLNFTGIMQSAVNNQKMYFADGVNWVLYNPSTNTVETWTATAGTLPVDPSNNTPRLICTWRGRTVLSGLLKDPQNWFMSAVSGPTDFNYSPVSPTPTQAIAGNNAPQGLIGDVITNLVPYTDDVLIFGGDHTIYMMRGDPMAGGQIDRVSDAIGMAWGQAWCMDPYGTIYFFSNRCGVYSLVPGEKPQRISQAIDSTLVDVDTGLNTIRLLWNDRFQGFHIFVSPTDEPSGAQHFFFEQRTGAWWQDEFADPNMDPLCCCTFDGNEPGDRVALIGSWDGYVRKVDGEATTDDGEEIDSEVWIGPLLTDNLDEVMMKDIQAILADGSGDVEVAIHTGATAEEALNSVAAFTETWAALRNLNRMVRRSGHAIYIKIASSVPWAMESLRVRLASQGKVRQRGR